MAKTLSYILFLGMVLVTVSLLVGYFASQNYLANGHSAAGKYSIYFASALAAGIVWFAGSIGLFLSTQSRSSQSGVSAMLLAMLVRVTIPLAAGLALARPGSELAATGFFGLIVAHYLVALFVETVLNVHWISQQKKGSLFV